LSVWRPKKTKNNQRTKLSIYILDTIESESTTRFKNRSLQHNFHIAPIISPCQFLFQPFVMWLRENYDYRN
jgi:hypothetical protein